METTQELAPLTPTDVTLAADVERSRFMPVMDTAIAMRRRGALVEAFKQLLKPSTKDDPGDYGKVAGIGKPTLMQAGAQKLDNLFGLVPRFEIVEREEDWTGAQHAGEPFFRYLVRCKLLRSDFVMGEAIGECNSWESKYRYRTADRLCPQCGKPTILFTKRNSWWCNKHKGGCGVGFPKGDQRIESQETGRKPNPEIFDQINTLLKMAQKRAHVGATINATSASEFFTQDVEDTGTTEEPTTPQPAPDADTRPIPDEYRLAFERIDKSDMKLLKTLMAYLETKFIEAAGETGLAQLKESAAAMRAKNPDNSKIQIHVLKSWFLDLWDDLQQLRNGKPQGEYVGVADDLPF